jgi:hypothetical protein
LSNSYSKASPEKTTSIELLIINPAFTSIYLENNYFLYTEYRFSNKFYLGWLINLYSKKTYTHFGDTL